MTRRLRIVIGSAIILVGLLVVLVLSFVGVTHTGFGRSRVRSSARARVQSRTTSAGRPGGHSALRTRAP